MGDSEFDSVTVWIQRLKAGSKEAPDAIWEKYFTRLVQFARSRLHSLPRRISDEEDIALSVLNSFVDGVRQARFPRLNDRDDLWRLLLVITSRKVVACRRRHFAGTRPDAHFAYAKHDDVESEADLLQEALGGEPTPEAAATFADEYQRLLASLPDDNCRQIVAWKLEGWTNREIALKLGTYEVKVERKLRLIRKQWSAETEHDLAGD